MHPAWLVQLLDQAAKRELYLHNENQMAASLFSTKDFSRYGCPERSSWSFFFLGGLEPKPDFFFVNVYITEHFFTICLPKCTKYSLTVGLRAVIS